MTKLMPGYLNGTDIEERFEESPVGGLVLGMQWGDEGKGKITDAMVQAADVVIRFNGGHNAGHSVKVGDKEYALHILPSGIVSEGKTNLIMSSCVLPIKLNKVDLKKLETSDNGVICNNTLDELLLKNDNGKIKEVGLIPELENLKKGGINIKNSGLKISQETPVIGMHNVLLDALDEKSRAYAKLGLIGSTGSGISRAYSSDGMRYHFTLQTLLTRPDDFYNSIKSLWSQVRDIFPKISSDELIELAKKEREQIIEYINNGTIEIIDNEKEYIDELVETNKKIIGEGAQSVMISQENSYFGTASTPSLAKFLEVTGLTSTQIGNVFGVHKMPPSSVGNRPGYMKIPESEELDNFRTNYKEYGVSSGRPRDLFYHSLIETARAVDIALKGLDDESKFVPVFNRVDGIENSLKLYPNKQLKVISGIKYRIPNYDQINEIEKKAGIHGNEKINRKELLKGYPSKSDQLNLFNIKQKKDVAFREIHGKDIKEQIQNLLEIHLAAQFDGDKKREYIIGTGPERNDLELRK